MTIQKQSAPAAAHSTDAALTGSVTAQNAAAKARAALETIVSPAITPKLSELPTKRERLHAVADAIEREELVKKGVGFNMGTWYGEKPGYQDRTGHRCGTVACIAGWTTALEDRTSRRVGVARSAMDILGISEEEADRLFLARNNTVPGGLRDISPAYAVAVLRHFAETNKVQWERFDNGGNDIGIMARISSGIKKLLDD